MRKLLLCCALWLGYGAVCAQNTLVVRDEQNLVPLEKVRVQVPNETYMTDLRGQVTLPTLDDQTPVTIARPGFEEQTLTYASLRDRGFALALRHDLVTLDEVVVATTRWEQPRRELPARVLTIDRREVNFRHPQTTADLIGLSNEVYIQKSQMGGGSPIIRGFAGNRLLIVVDGVRMNNAIFRSGNLQSIITLGAQHMEQAEVIMSPASVMYGSDAIGGVMSFRTLTPQLNPGGGTRVTGEAFTRYASASEERMGHLHVGFSGRRWAALTAVTFNEFGDLRMGSRGPDVTEQYLRPFIQTRVGNRDTVRANPNPEVQTPTGFNQLNVMQKVRFQPNSRLDFQYGLHVSTGSDVPRYERYLRTRNGQFRTAEWFYGPQNWIMNNLTVNHQGNGRLYDQARLTLAHQFYQESRIERNFGRDDRQTQQDGVNVLSANLDFEKRLASIHTLNYGVEALHNRNTSEATERNIVTNETEPIQTRYPDGATWQAYAAYASWKAELSPQFTLLAGTRYTQTLLEGTLDTTFLELPFNRFDINTGALSGSLGFTYRPTQNLLLSLNGATGFRSPALDDVAKTFDRNAGQVVVPNDDLTSEYSYNIEGGFVYVVDRNVQFEVNAFYTLLDNALVRRPFQLGGQDSIIFNDELSQVLAVQNIDQVNMYGASFSVRLQLLRDLRLRSDLTYTMGTESDENDGDAPDVRARFAVPLFGGTHLIYQRRRVRVELFALYNGGISAEELSPYEEDKREIYPLDEQGRAFFQSWATLNLMTSYQITPNLQLNAGVENITDLRYRHYSTGIAAPGRNFIVGLRGFLN